jgi:Tfp pilus assembly protein PilF
LFTTAVLFTFGCSSRPVKSYDLLKIFRSTGEQALSEGIKNYEDGKYKLASENLKTALSKGLSHKNDQVKAHKYLAFISCVSGQEKQCRGEFKKACEIDPNFELGTAEKGHPIWGPVFLSVKSETATDKTR